MKIIIEKTRNYERIDKILDYLVEVQILNKKYLEDKKKQVRIEPIDIEVFIGEEKSTDLITFMCEEKIPYRVDDDDDDLYIIGNYKEKIIIQPQHYTDKGIQPIEYIEYIEVNKMDFIEGNCIKYITRYKNKDGIKDLLKAKWYLDRLIERNRVKKLD